MKGRESGMPEEVYWQSFYDADCIVEKLECAKEKKESIAEFGCGYGTFTFPAAKRTSGVVHAFDIEPELVAHVQRRAKQSGLSNVRAEVRDFVAQGTGLPSRSIDHAMVYNLLHIEGPVALLKEAFRILKPGGVLSIVHWKYDPATPRGPSMIIRPRPEQCRAWAEAAGFHFVRDQDLSECCQYHYGLLLIRPRGTEKAAKQGAERGSSLTPSKKSLSRENSYGRRPQPTFSRRARGGGEEAARRHSCPPR